MLEAVSGPRDILDKQRSRASAVPIHVSPEGENVLQDDRSRRGMLHEQSALRARVKAIKNKRRSGSAPPSTRNIGSPVFKPGRASMPAPIPKTRRTVGGTRSVLPIL
jgi:hypothetical protein